MTSGQGMPLCGTFPHCDQTAVDAFERFFGNEAVISHLKSKKAAAAMALSLCKLMREDRGNVLRLADRGAEWAVSKDGTVEAKP